MQSIELIIICVGAIVLSMILREKNIAKTRLLLLSAGLSFVFVGILIVYLMGADVTEVLCLNSIRGFGRTVAFGYIFLLAACILQVIYVYNISKRNKI